MNCTRTRLPRGSMTLLLAPPPPLSRQYSTGDRRRGEEVGKEPNPTTAGKPGPPYFIQYSLLQPLEIVFTSKLHIPTVR